MNLSCDFSDAILDSLRESELLSSEQPAAGEHEVEVTVHVERFVHHQTGLISLATALLIPGVQDRRLCVATTLVERASGKQARREVCREFRIWYELVFLPIYPWHSPARYERRLVGTLARNTTVEALSELGAAAPAAHATCQSSPYVRAPSRRATACEAAFSHDVE